MTISVIIPIYNAEAYLEECIDSILTQKYVDYEILLINDGSTDTSAEICDNYAKKDQRIKVFHKENSGVSSARNLGLQNAQGEWIAFIDSDDYISEHYFQPIFEYENQDYIIMNSFVIRDGSKSNFRSYESKSLNLDNFLNEYNLFRDFATPWGKFFRKSIIDENNILFDEQLNRGEDVVFNLTYVLKCKTIGISNSSSYNYRITGNSLSSKKSKVSHSVYLYDKIFVLLQCYSEDMKFISKHISFLALGYFLSVLNSDYSKENKKKILKELINKHKKYLVVNAKGQRIHFIPLDWLISHELIDFLIFISNK